MGSRKSRLRYQAPTGKTWKFSPKELVVIGVDTDHGPKDHPLWRARSIRVSKKDKTLWSQEFAEEIAQVGILTPIRIRREFLDVSGKEDHYPVVVAGVRRVLHAREAVEIRRRKKIPGDVLLECSEVRGDDLTVIGVALHENRHRRDDDPVAQAREVQKAMAIGSDLATICSSLGVSEAWVRKRLRLLDIDASVQRMVTSGELSVPAAASMSKLPRAKQGKAAKQAARRGGTQRDAEAVVSEMTGIPAARRRRGNKELMRAIRGMASDSAFVAGVRYALGHDVDPKKYR